MRNKTFALAILFLSGCNGMSGMAPSSIAGGGITGILSGSSTPPAQSIYKPAIDQASAPNGGADYEKHIAICHGYIASDEQQKESGAVMSSALQGLMSGMSGVWSSGLSGSSMGTALGNAASAGATKMLQEQRAQKTQQHPVSGQESEFMRTCLRSYGYKVVE